MGWDLPLLLWESRPAYIRRRKKRHLNDDESFSLTETRQENLSLHQILAYVNMKCSLIYGDLAVGVAIPVYQEAYGLDIGTCAVRCMFLLLSPLQLSATVTLSVSFCCCCCDPSGAGLLNALIRDDIMPFLPPFRAPLGFPGTLATVRAVAKAFDMAVSFVIGYASDATRTSFGRRLPFIFVGSLVAPVAMWYLAAPPPLWNLNLERAKTIVAASGGATPYEKVNAACSWARNTRARNLAVHRTALYPLSQKLSLTRNRVPWLLRCACMRSPQQL